MYLYMEKVTTLCSNISLVQLSSPANLDSYREENVLQNLDIFFAKHYAGFKYLSLWPCLFVLFLIKIA